jgi:hypothetical protein
VGIAHAEALVVWEGGAAFDYAVSDTKGHFSAARLGGCSDDCEVVVRAAGFEPYRAPVARHCTKRQRGACLWVEVEARLAATAR